MSCLCNHHSHAHTWPWLSQCHIPCWLASWQLLPPRQPHPMPSKTSWPVLTPVHMETLNPHPASPGQSNQIQLPSRLMQLSAHGDAPKISQPLTFHILAWANEQESFLCSCEKYAHYVTDSATDRWQVDECWWELQALLRGPLFIYFFCFLGLHLWPMEVPRLGVKSATAAGLHHSHSNGGTWAASATYTTAHCNSGSLTDWARPGIEPTSSWILGGFATRWATTGTPNMFLYLYI